MAPQSLTIQPSRRRTIAVAVGRVLLGVRDLDDGGALVVELLEEAHDLAALVGVEVAGRLVGEQQLRLGDERPGNADELLLAAGELVREEVLLADDLEAVERVGHDRGALGALDVAVGERDVEVLGDREVVEQVVLLEDEADVLFVELDALLRLHRVDLVLEQPVFARPVVVEHAEDREQGRLAGARGAHDRHELALGDREVDPAEQEGLAGAGRQGLFDVRELNHRVHSPFNTSFGSIRAARRAGRPLSGKRNSRRRAVKVVTPTSTRASGSRAGRVGRARHRRRGRRWSGARRRPRRSRDRRGRLP